MRFHIIAPAHTLTVPEWSHCAYTQKHVKKVELLKGLGHEVISYGSQGAQTAADENVAVVSRASIRREYGGHGIGLHNFQTESKALWAEQASRLSIELPKRRKDGDFILIIWGGSHFEMVKFWQELNPIVEYGIGYEGVVPDTFHAFESYAWMHRLADRLKWGVNRAYDAVIPNYFRAEDFKFAAKKGDYLLCLGRVIPSKGVAIAVHAAAAAGVRLVIAGQSRDDKGKIQEPAIFTENGKLRRDLPGKVEYVGGVGPKERRELLAHAAGLMALTRYLGPFEGVTVEANLSGTPVITSDWGCFAETVLHGVTGFRTRTMNEIVHAIGMLPGISPKVCQMWAAANYSMGAVAQKFQAFYQQIADLRAGKQWGYVGDVDQAAFLARYGTVHPHTLAAVALAKAKEGKGK